MAAITVNGADAGKAFRRLETIAITNQTANSTVVRKAVRVPDWADSMAFYVYYEAAAGTSPLFDFSLEVPDTAADGSVDDSPIGNLGDWDGITQVTGTGPYLFQVDVGPNITADDTGSATASSRYGVEAALPPVVVYKYTTDGTTDDEDYAVRICVKFNRAV